MNIEAANELFRIVNKDINDLTENDKGFIRARRSYLTADSKAKFAEVLGAKPEASNELQELREHAKRIGIKAVHFYKTVESLKEKIAEVESK